MFRNATIRAKLALITGFSVLIMIIVGSIAITCFNSVKKDWTDYLKVVQTKQDHLMDIRARMGYGGAIHIFKNYVLRGSQKYFDGYEKKADAIIAGCNRYRDVGNLSPAESDSLPIIVEMAEKYRKASHTARKLLNQGKTVKEIDAVIKIDDTPYLDALDSLSKELKRQTSVRSEAFSALIRRAASLLTVIIAASGVLLVIFGILIVHSINTALGRSITLLAGSSEKVSSASDQLSASCQSRARDASGQAASVEASIEETSSSMEELSSMTRQNADNAGQADNLMKETNQIVSKANRSMTELTTSMDDISKASEETSKIVKTIDEIAFQTNLLALNAAVEAARAGEAGSGFAVVADEVRNLAMRAADAAKNTADLIEGTVKKVNDGAGLVTRTNDDFGKVAESAGKVGELVGEISAASGEQAEGIDLINKAIAEMDRIVQQNAAGAEESASVSEELNILAKQMKTVVGDLTALIGERKNKSGRPAPAPAPHSINHHTAAPMPRIGSNNTPAPKTRQIPPEQVIPMDDDFTDF